MGVREAIAIASRCEDVPGEILEAAFGEIMDDKASPVQVAALLIALRTKGESVNEIVSAARALRARAVRAIAPSPNTVDTCGTGGDGAETFNISTTAAFVVAGAGVPVAKHGNRAASSRAGCIDTLEALGVNIDLSVSESQAVCARVGIATFFARNAHPAMRFVAPVRAELGVRTIMNCLGPLLNPLGVRYQVIGVYSAALVEPIAQALLQLGSERALVVHGDDGLDEITTTTTTEAAYLYDGRVRKMAIDPSKFGIARALGSALRGGDAKDNAAILQAVLSGESGARRDIVLINAAAAIWVAGVAANLEEGIVRAAQSIDSGAAHKKLDDLIRETAKYKKTGESGK